MANAKTRFIFFNYPERPRCDGTKGGNAILIKQSSGGEGVKVEKVKDTLIRKGNSLRRWEVR